MSSCFLLFHKWDYKLIHVSEMRWKGTPIGYEYLYVGTCQKCGAIKRKLIRSN